MFNHLGLRLRMFLIFAGFAAATIGIVCGALFYSYSRAMENGDMTGGFITAALFATFGILGISAGLWLLFDENVAKPIDYLAAHLRTHAHAGARVELDADATKYLGDLAPAAHAISKKLGSSTMDQAEAVAQATAQLSAERDRLTALLTEIPVAMILVNPQHQIVLYDGQAAEALASVAPPRMGADVSDYLCQDSLKAAYDKMVRSGKEVAVQIPDARGQQQFDARLRPLGNAPGYMIVLEDVEALIDPSASRPLSYDFKLLEQPAAKACFETTLRDLSYVVFDTETTGLLPHKDSVVQLGALRVVRGRMIPHEAIDTLVNPGRPIPAASTKVHGINDRMVQGAPDFISVGKKFHQFCAGSVIVAHNAPFDMAFLHRDSKKMGVNFDNPILDTVLLSAVLFGPSAKHTLDAICDRLAITIPAELRHTAMGDAVATAEVLCAMIPMCEAKGIRTFGDLVAETRKHGRLLQDLNVPA